MTRIFAVLLAVILCIGCSFPASAAIDTGNNYSYNDYGEIIPAPLSYMAERVASGDELGCGALNSPQDIFFYSGGAIIADTGNNRIVLLDTELKCQRILEGVEIDGEFSAFSEPQGVFVTKGGELYICDTGNARILRLDKDLKVLHIYGKPETELLEEDFIFAPQKVAVDTSGSVYVVANAMYQGLAEYDNQGEFTGFFGSNKIELTADVLISYYWKKLLSSDQGQAMTRLIPIQYSNLFIDEKNFIYTVTSETDTSKNEVKKLSALGNNVLHFEESELYDKSDFGDLEKDNKQGVELDSKIVDVFVDDDGVMNLLDARRGRVFQYDKNCQLLGIFGNLGTQKGTFKTPAAIDKYGEYYVILDSQKNSLTFFKPTDYAIKLRSAVKSYNDGKYSESIDLWKELLKENSALSIAYRGIGKALMRENDYEGAMEYFKNANDRDGYSQALREARKVYARENAIYFIVAAVVLYIAYSFFKRIYKKHKKRN